MIDHGGRIDRWDALFADLQAQMEAAERSELHAEVAERVRRDRTEVTLADRLAGRIGHEVAVRLLDGTHLNLFLIDLGEGWILGSVEASSYLIPLDAVVSVSGLPAQAADVGSRMRFGFGYALRALSRDRAVVALRERSGLVISGTIDGIGADYLELAEHPTDQPRRAANITGIRTIRLSAILSVRSAARG